jgi:hypothetical protein
MAFHSVLLVFLFASEEYGMGSNGLDSPPHKNRKNDIYDRICALKCIGSYPVPHFDQRHFERPFRLKKGMINPTLSKLDKHNKFWTQSIDCNGQINCL